MPCRRSLALLLAGCALLATACGPPAEQTRNEPGQIAAPPGLATPGALTVAVPASLPPYGYRGAHGRSQGFAVDLATAMADRLGLRAEIVALDPQDLLAAGRGGGVDVVIATTPISATTPSPPGFALVPYLSGAAVLLVRNGSAFQPQHLAELCGHRVVAVAGTPEESLLGDAGCGAAPPQVHAVPGNDAALSALRDGDAEVYAADAATAAYDIAHAPVQSTSPELGNVDLGLALRSDSGPVRDSITRAYYTVHSDGSYEVLALKWGLDRRSL